MNDELENDFRTVATEVMLSDDPAKATDHVRQLAMRVAQRVNQVNENRRIIDKHFREWLAEHEEDLVSDPEIMKRVQAREQVLLKRFPGMDHLKRWHRAANEVRERYGTADQRVIRGMRQQRLGARLASDTESYTFDTGSSNDDDPVDDAADAEILADHSSAILEMRIGRLGRRVEVDKERYNEQELRRRQRNQG